MSSPIIPNLLPRRSTQAEPVVSLSWGDWAKSPKKPRQLKIAGQSTGEKTTAQIENTLQYPVPKAKKRATQKDERDYCPSLTQSQK